jgi:hypothetical protein
MDVKDRCTTSSKEQLRSLVHVHQLDEITSNGGKDRSVTKEHPWGLKRKRPDFMQEEPPSWTRGWHRQNSASGGGEVHNYMRTHRSEGATEPGRDRPGPVGRPDPLPGSVRPPFLAPEGSSTLSPWRHCHLQRREPFTLKGHRQARERERREIFGGRSLNSKEAPSSGEERRHRRKRHHDQRCHVYHLDGVIFSFVHGL